MLIRKKAPRALGLNEPLRHGDHKRPVSRRDFIAQGFIGGSVTVVAPAMMGGLLSGSAAHADVLADLDAAGVCGLGGVSGASSIPFICFDLAGGANIAGSNVLVGTSGQLDLLSTAGYSKLGLPGDMTPASSTTNFVDSTFGLAFHSDSAFLRGIKMVAVTAGGKTNGAVIPARSENDTGNNPHNPMYGIAKAGAHGQLLTLIGSRSSDSGGNSMAPASMLDAELRPTKVDRVSDATGLIDTGKLSTLLPLKDDRVKVMESVARLSRQKIDPGITKIVKNSTSEDARLRQLVDCSYVKSAWLAENFADPADLDPTKDTNITSIFSGIGGISADPEFEKTAAIMKLVIGGAAGAGTITMGGFDYHTGDRATGEARDFRAGICMGACLEYAARMGKPLMLYVFSDGSLNSNGMVDNSTGGRGKGQWTGDNQSTAASFFLVYNPNGRAAPRHPVTSGAGPQLGKFQASGDVNTQGSPGANSVVSLVDMVVMNYLALLGRENEIGDISINSVFKGNTSLIDTYTAFNSLT